MESIKGIIENQMLKCVKEEIIFWGESIKQWEISIITICDLMAKEELENFVRNLDYLERYIAGLKSAQTKHKEAIKNYYLIIGKEVI